MLSTLQVLRQFRALAVGLITLSLSLLGLRWPSLHWFFMHFLPSFWFIRQGVPGQSDIFNVSTSELNSLLMPQESPRYLLEDLCQIFVIGSVPNGRTVVLNVPNFHLVTVGKIMELLMAGRIISEHDVGSFYLNWKGKPLPTLSSLSDIGLRPHSTLVLGLRVLGGSVHDNTKKMKVTVDIPPHRYHGLRFSVLQPSQVLNGIHRENVAKFGDNAVQVVQGTSTTNSSYHLSPIQPGGSNSRSTVIRKRRQKEIDDGTDEDAFQQQFSASDSDGGSAYEESPAKVSRPLKKQKLINDWRIESRPARRRPQVLSSNSRKIRNISTDTAMEKRVSRKRDSYSKGVPQQSVSTLGSISGKLQIGKDGNYEFAGGVKCRCDHLTPNQSSISAISSALQGATARCDEDIDETCGVLSALDMCIYKPFNVVLCKEHGRLLDSHALRNHLEKYHPQSLQKVQGGGPAKRFQLVVQHVKEAYGIPEEHSHLQHKVIDRPVPFLEPPSYFAHCPNCNTPAGYAQLHSARLVLSKHFEKNPDCKSSAAVTRLLKVSGAGPNRRRRTKDWKSLCDATKRYGQVGSMAGSHWIIYCAEDWVPPAFEDNICLVGPVHLSTEAAPLSGKKKVVDQSYVSDLGWDRAFYSEKASMNMADTWQELLYWRATSDADHPLYEDQQALERGLSEVQEFLYDYLASANGFLENCSDILRRELTKGSRSKYRKLAPTTLLRYKEALFDPIALLIWLRHAFIAQRPVGEDIDLHLTKAAIRAVNELYKFFLAIPQDDDVPREKMAIYVHRLLAALLTSQAGVEHKIGGPFDFAMALSAYKGYGEYREAGFVGRYCARLQFGMRSITIHVVRLGGLNAEFTIDEAKPTNADDIPGDGTERPMPTLSPVDLEDEEPGVDASNPLAVDEEELDDLDLEDDELCGGTTDGQNSWMSMAPSTTFKDPFCLDDDEDIMDQDSNLEPKKDEFLTTLKSHYQWISNESETGNNQPTAFQRVKSTWLIVWPIALKAISSTQITSDGAGMVFTYSSLRCDPHKISLASIKTLISSLMMSAKENLLVLLPSQLNQAEFTISVSSLLDNHARMESIFEQNEERFQLLAERMFEMLMADDEENHQISRAIIEGKRKRSTRFMWKTVQKWVQRQEDLLESILGGISLATGITARAFQMADLCYTSSSDGKRNVFIIKDTVVIGWPKSKSFNRTTQASLWALPPELGEILLLYLGVIRPVSLRIMERLNRKPSRWETSHIFVCWAPFGLDKGGGQIAWNTVRIDAILQSITHSALGLALTASKMRQMITAIFRKHLSDLIDPVITKTSYANMQADHSQATYNQNYGIGAGPLSGLDLSDGDIDRFMEVSHAWQAMHGLLPGARRLLDRLLKVPVYVQEQNRLIAMDLVRSVVCHEYGIGGDFEKSRKMAVSFLERKPFFPKAGEKLGDRVLIQIVSAIAYGHGKPGLNDSAPIHGYPAESVTDAIALIMLGLKEWTGKEKWVRYDIRDSAVKNSIGKAMRKVLPIMQKMRQELEEKWREMGVEIFKYASEMERQVTEEPNLIDDLEVDKEMD